MKNKHVGILVVGISVLFFFIVMSFNKALNSIVELSCTHGEMCPMQATLQTQEIISYGLMGLLLLVGLFMIFFMKDEKVYIEKKHISDEEKKTKLENLDDEERSVMNIVLRKEGSVYQSDLIKELKVSKVKVSRLLDKLEGKGLIERKRRGMTNVIVLR